MNSIRSIFESLTSELEPHIMKEERVRFPFIMQIEQAVNEKTAASTAEMETAAIS